MKEYVFRRVKGKIRRWELEPKEKRRMSNDKERLGKGELAKFPKFTDPYMEINHVKESFIKRRKKNSGKLTKDKNLDLKNHLSEIFTASWMISKLGGDFKIIKEGTEKNVSYVDLEWNGKIWEVKSPSSLRAIDNRLSEAFKKLDGLSDENARRYEGIILNLNQVEKRGTIKSNSNDEIIKVVENRLIGYATKKMFVIIKRGNELVDIIKVDYK